MKPLFVLGAGASYTAGVPLLADFLDRAERLFRTENDVAAQDVFRAISELQTVYSKSYLDLDNLETVFGAIEMATLIGKLAERDRDSIKNLRANLISLIVRTIERTTLFPISNGERLPAKPYGEFVGIMSAFGGFEYANEPKLTFSCITFNYDLALDHALAVARVPFHYGLSTQVKNNQRAIPLLKLHGSINWGQCNNCQKIVPFEVGTVIQNHLSHGVTRAPLSLGSNIASISHCNAAVTGPFLVPPTWNKTAYHGDLVDVWAKAAHELSTAQNIVIIGYSIPETDAFFRYLFALGSASQTRIKRLWLVNTDRSNEYVERVRSLAGNGIRSRIRFLPQTFEDAIDEIREFIRSEHE